MTLFLQVSTSVQPTRGIGVVVVGFPRDVALRSRQVSRIRASACGSDPGRAYIRTSRRRATWMAPEQRVGTVGIAAALVAGVVACLSLPALPHWAWFLALLIAGAIAFATSAFRSMPHACSYGAMAVFGFSLAGLHAAHAMSQRLPDAPGSRDATVAGTIVDLPVTEPRRVRFHFRIDDNATQHPQLRGRLVRLAWYEDRD